MSSRDEIIGNSRRNLVIKTAGIIRVLVGDKYYDINFKDSAKESDEDGNIIGGTSPEEFFIVVDSISDFDDGGREYPGDGKVIFTLDGRIYYTTNNEYIEYGSKENVDIYNDTFNTPIELFGTPPMFVHSMSIVNNLNADLLDGYNASDFVLKEDLNKNSGVNKFEYINIDSAYTLSFNKYTSFSILSNGNTVKFPSSYNNGLEVHIYTIDDTNIDTGTEVVHSIAGEYNIFRCVPISMNEYSWIMVSDNN